MNLIKWISVLDRHIKQYLDRQFMPYGFNSSQHMYILKICENPGLTQEQLIKLFHIHPSNITRALNVLIKLGYIRKETSRQDKRTSLLFPTGQAEKVYPELVALIEKTEERLLKELKEEIRPIFGEETERLALYACRMAAEGGMETIEF